MHTIEAVSSAMLRLVVRRLVDPWRGGGCLSSTHRPTGLSGATLRRLGWIGTKQMASGGRGRWPAGLLAAGLLGTALSGLVGPAGAAPPSSSQQRSWSEPRSLLAPSQAPAAQTFPGASLLDRADVVATGIGRDEDGRPTLLVFVTGDAAAAEVPATVGSLPTTVVATAPFVTQACPNGPTGLCDRPVPPGVSAGHPLISAGTLGVLLEGPTGAQYALSNNHVFAAENQGQIGDPILQPGAFDGGTVGDPDELLGTLAAYQQVALCDPDPCDAGATLNVVDAALAAVAPETVERRNACGWTPASTPLSTAAIVPGITQVKKCGRTSGATTGTVIAVNVQIDVGFATGSARFVGQVMTTSMALPGDSGSLLADTDNRPVGLLMAGNDSFTVSNPITAVLDRFGVTIDDGIPGPPPPGPPPPACLPPLNSWGTKAVTGFATSTGGGYWLARADGSLVPIGNASFQGDASCLPLNGPVLGGAAAATGVGYWLNGQDGGVFTYGSAHFFGSMGATPLNQPVFSMAATLSGNGYWLVAHDGGIFSFGDAGFHGSTGAITLVQPIVAISPSPTGAGYRLAARDGGLFSFGDAPFFGSLPGVGVTATDVVGMAPTPSGQGYWIVRAGGQTYAFGDAPHLGNHAANPADPVVAVFANPVEAGYRLVLASGATVPFGTAPG